MSDEPIRPRLDEAGVEYGYRNYGTKPPPPIRPIPEQQGWVYGRPSKWDKIGDTIFFAVMGVGMLTVVGLLITLVLIIGAAR